MKPAMQKHNDVEDVVNFVQQNLSFALCLLFARFITTHVDETLAEDKYCSARNHMPKVASGIAPLPFEGENSPFRITTAKLNHIKHLIYKGQHCIPFRQ